MRAAPLVVDASVAVKWLIEEPGTEAAVALRDGDLAAPALLRIEVANALRSLVARGTLTRTRAMALLGKFHPAPASIVQADEALERRALEIALDLSHPIYDCVYLALAERTSRTLATADARFLRALAGTPHAGRAVALA